MLLNWEHKWLHNFISINGVYQVKKTNFYQINSYQHIVLYLMLSQYQ